MIDTGPLGNGLAALTHFQWSCTGNMDFLPSFSFLKPQVVWGKLVQKTQSESLAAEVRSIPCGRAVLAVLREGGKGAGISSRKEWAPRGNSIFCCNFIPLLHNCQSLHCPA